MITIADTQKLIEVMKLEFVTKDEFNQAFDGLNLKIDKTLNATDAFVKRTEVYYQEMSTKTGVDYPF